MTMGGPQEFPCIVLLTQQMIVLSNTEEYGEFANPCDYLEIWRMHLQWLLPIDSLSYPCTPCAIIREPGYEASSMVAHNNFRMHAQASI